MATVFGGMFQFIIMWLLILSVASVLFNIVKDYTFFALKRVIDALRNYLANTSTTRRFITIAFLGIVISSGIFLAFKFFSEFLSEHLIEGIILAVCLFWFYGLKNIGSASTRSFSSDKKACTFDSNDSSSPGYWTRVEEQRRDQERRNDACGIPRSVAGETYARPFGC